MPPFEFREGKLVQHRNRIAASGLAQLTVQGELAHTSKSRLLATEHELIAGFTKIS